MEELVAELHAIRGALDIIAVAILCYGAAFLCFELWREGK